MTELRQVEPFERVALLRQGTLNISIGDECKVSVTTDDNLVELVETSVQNGELKIEPLKALNPKVDLIIDVTIPKLTAVELAGAVKLNLQDVETENLDLELAGMCSANGSGRVGKLSLEMAGACRADLKSLEAKAAGLGKITCYGNPHDVKKEAAGISKVTIVGGN